MRRIKMHRYARIPSVEFIAACALVWLVQGVACAAETIDVSAFPGGRIELAGRFELLVDPGGRMTLADALASNGFVAADRGNTSIGFTNAAVWARFRMHYPDEARSAFVLSFDQALLDRAELYVIESGRRYPARIAGDTLPFARRDAANRAVNFELAARPGEVVDYYLRVTGPTSAIALPLVVFDSDAFNAHAAQEQALLGGYFGAMGALALTAFLLFVLVRDLTFMFFGMYLAAYGMVMLAFSGYGFEFFWPGDPLLQQRLPTPLIAIAVLAGTLISRRFLDSPRRIPASEWIYLAAAALAIIGACLHLGRPGHLGTQLTLGAVLLLVPSVLVFGIRCARTGDRLAQYWLAGWVFYVAGVSATVLHAFGLLAHMPLTAYGVYLGSLADFLGLSIALSARVWILRREKALEVQTIAAELAELNDNLDEIVSTRTRDLEKRNSELSELAIRDSLTGLYNHSTSIELLDQLLQQSQRYEFPLATIMVDLDHFKGINDSFGHQVGDRVLEAVSEALIESVRGSDMVGRYGGEEFLIAMSHADAFAAREYGERLLRRIRELEIPALNGASITASIGITVYYPHGFRDSAQEVIERADEALYRSKTEGRDRLTIESLSLVAGTGTRRQRDGSPPASKVENPSTPA